MTHRTRRSRHLVVIALCLLSAACDATPGPTGATTSAPAPPTSATTDAAPSSSPTADEIAAARTAIEAADPADDATLGAVEGLRFTKLGAEAAREVLETSDDPGALWAALWVYGSASGDPSPLKRLVDQEDATIATLAAAGLVSDGDAAGFARLAKAVVDPSPLVGAHPPGTISAYAAAILGSVIGPTAKPPTLPVDGTDAQVGKVWAPWLDAHAASLTFDASTGLWGSA